MLHGRTRTSSTRPARWVAFALTLAVTALLALAGASAASAQQSAPAFSTSFEPTQPPPTWSDTVEAGRSSNVDGTLASATIPGNVTDKVVEVQASGENPPNESKEKAVDGNIQSKWLTFTSTAWLQVKLSEPVKVVTYALTSANDSEGRDPQDWNLQGSNDGQSWTTLDTRSGEDFPERFQTRQFDIANDTAYTYYRLNVTKNSGDDIVQLGELQLSTGGSTSGPPPYMRAFVDHGPEQRAEHQAQRRLHRPAGAALRRRPRRRRARLLLRQGLRRRRPGPPRHAALLQDLPGAHQGRPAVPEHLRRGRPRVLRRHLPVRPRRARPARRDREPAGPGRVEDALRRPVERQVVADRRRRGRQDDQADHRRLRQPRRHQGHRVQRLDRRHPDRRRDATGPEPPVRLGRHAPRHELERLVLARQQLPRDRRPARVQLLDADDRRGLAELALQLPVAEQRGQPADAAGVHREPHAEPVDGRPADVPGDALDGLRHA